MNKFVTRFLSYLGTTSVVLLLLFGPPAAGLVLGCWLVDGNIFAGIVGVVLGGIVSFAALMAALERD